MPSQERENDVVGLAHSGRLDGRLSAALAGDFAPLGGSHLTEFRVSVGHFEAQEGILVDEGE
jgi:hypothetical protein